MAPSLALHQLLYDAFQWKAPEFAHLPLIMKPVGKRKVEQTGWCKRRVPGISLWSGRLTMKTIWAT